MEGSQDNAEGLQSNVDVSSAANEGLGGSEKRDAVESSKTQGRMCEAVGSIPCKISDVSKVFKVRRKNNR